MLSTVGCAFHDEETLFRQVPPSRSGIRFRNEITVTDSVNGLTFEYIYNGGGVAVGDFNNDGLKDLFFAGNMVSSKLYLNEGALRFRDVTADAGLVTDRWCTGVSVVDINDDGLQDIYICVAGPEAGKSRENIFFINQGIDNNGIPHFEDRSAVMGLDDEGYSTMGVFFDYDKDGDLDLYILTNSMEGSMRNAIRPIRVNGEAESTDRLYRNTGHGKFTDFSREAGILIEGYGLGVALCDINQDGWSDIYCADDFISNDLLWINNGDGTFTESAGEYFYHFTNSGMGMDIADINNDALPDVIVLDMLPPDNLRQKLMIPYRNTGKFYSALKSGYLPQFLRNTFQLNRGKFKDGKYRFSEIAYLSGIYQTDWSWAPLLADFDNDGWKDLLITNGFRKDVTNLDYIRKIIEQSRFGDEETRMQYMISAMEKLPDVKLPNYIFKNEGNLLFTDKSHEWGLTMSTFTNGTAFADLDNDGDLDIVLNNIDQEAVLYENRLLPSYKSSGNHGFLIVRFSSKVRDYEKIGLKIWVFQNGNRQFFEYSPYRGYKSTVEQDIHIGLGAAKVIDSLVIQWNDGLIQIIDNLAANEILEISKSAKHATVEGSYIKNFMDTDSSVGFNDITNDINVDYKHEEMPSGDFKITPTLLHKLSAYGPSISVGDINMDGREDFFVGADHGRNPAIFIQRPDNTFMKNDFPLDSNFEDMGALLFDADDDGDPDLYVVSGGYRWQAGSSQYQDRLYFNDGTGNFSKREDALPSIAGSGSCVVAADYDKDGDLDLFIGGRVEGRNYPLTPQSYLLENSGGTFENRSERLPDQGRLGMVTSAIWTDVDNDGWPDLMIVGEWMPVTVLLNKNGRFVNATSEYSLDETTGWWNSITGADLDLDGDTDYILGNYGLNSYFKPSPEKPVEIYCADFDRNGRVDPIITQYFGDEAFIVHPYNILTDLIPGIKNRFKTYSDYGSMPFRDSFLPEELAEAFRLNCKMMRSVVLENKGGKRFEIHDLPVEVQFSPVFGILAEDINGDQMPDLIMVGNSFSDETITGYYDASLGNIMINKGNFQWTAIQPVLSDFVAEGDKKALARIIVNNRPVYLISVNDGDLQAYIMKEQSEPLHLHTQQNDWFVIYDFNGLTVKREIYRGSGFLSASSTSILIPHGAKKITVRQYSGSTREIN